MRNFAYHIHHNGEHQSFTQDNCTIPTANDGFYWIDMDPKDPANKDWVVQQVTNDSAVIDILFTNTDRPRLEVFDHSLVLSLRGVNFQDKDSPEDMVNIRFLITKQGMISFHTREMRSVKVMKSYVDKGHKFTSQGTFLFTFLKLLNAFIFDETENLNDTLSQLEEAALEGDILQAQGQLADVRRLIIGFQKFLIPQANVLHQLIESEGNWFKKKDRVHLKNEAEHLSTYVGELEHLRQRAAVLQEEIKSGLSDQINQNIYRLTIVATIMLPLSMFAGLMGANVGGIPFSQSPYGFLIICLLTMGFGAIVYILLKLLKWI
jgi:zinc transporter